jgi:CRP/FNR family transcriptional regulator, dissimilatory nitrate respiration regulator
VAQPGEAFAEASLFSWIYHCDAVADVRSRVIVYSKPGLLRALREDPGAALALPSPSRTRYKRSAAGFELLYIKSARDRLLAYCTSSSARRSDVWTSAGPGRGLPPKLG